MVGALGGRCIKW